MTHAHSQETIDRVSALAAESLSAAKIGAELGLSRNAIIGICARRGIKLNGFPKPKAPRPRPDKIIQLRRHRACKVYLVIPDEQRTDLIGILDLTLTTCHWPIGERPIMFCGRETVEGKSYCANHHARSIRRGKEAEAA